MAKKTLLTDSRWEAFVVDYAFDLARFSIEVCGIEPSHQQMEIYESVQYPGSRTTVSSGHSTGKSVALAVIALWHLLCWYSFRESKGSVTMLTANDIKQVQNIVWKEIEALKIKMAEGPHAWICDYFTVMAERVYVNGFKKTWFVYAKTAPAGKPNALAGQHGDCLLIIADEAATIPDGNFVTLTGALSHRDNRMLLTSQPTRSLGYFYETHHRLSIANRGAWFNITLNSEESPFASDEFLAEKLLEYGGRDTEDYCVRVRGIFPENNSKYLISRKVLDAAYGRAPVIARGDYYGYLLLVDVAAGEDRDKSVVMVVKVSGTADFGPDARRVHVIDIPVFSSSIQPDQLAGDIIKIADRYPGATTLVDAMGMGILFCKQLDLMGFEGKVDVKWQKPCFLQRQKDLYANQRAHAYVGMRNAARDGRLSFGTTDYQQEFLNQAARIPYGYDARNRYLIARKGSKDWEGLGSPDLADALAFGFLADATFIPMDDPEDGGDGGDDVWDAIAKQMEQGGVAAGAAARLDQFLTELQRLGSANQDHIRAMPANEGGTDGTRRQSAQRIEVVGSRGSEPDRKRCQGRDRRATHRDRARRPRRQVQAARSRRLRPRLQRQA